MLNAKSGCQAKLTYSGHITYLKPVQTVFSNVHKMIETAVSHCAQTTHVHSQQKLPNRSKIHPTLQQCREILFPSFPQEIIL